MICMQIISKNSATGIDVLSNWFVIHLRLKADCSILGRPCLTNEHGCFASAFFLSISSPVLCCRFTCKLCVQTDHLPPVRGSVPCIHQHQRFFFAGGSSDSKDNQGSHAEMRVRNVIDRLGSRPLRNQCIVLSFPFFQDMNAILASFGTHEVSAASCSCLVS